MVGASLVKVVMIVDKRFVTFTLFFNFDRQADRIVVASYLLLA